MFTIVENKHIVSLANLPFKPVKGQVIYVDPDYNKRVNAFIVNNYNWLIKTFKQKGLEFCYLPLREEELIAYHAPHLTSEQRRELLLGIPSIADFIKTENSLSLYPCLLFSPDDVCPDSDGNLKMRLITIDTRRFLSLKKVFSRLARSILADQILYYRYRSQNEKVVSEPTVRYSVSEDGDNPEEPEIRFSLQADSAKSDDEPRILFSVVDETKDLDYESLELIAEIRKRIETLRNKGVNTMVLHSIVDDGEHLSPIHITKDFRIILPDYNNMEVTLPALPKAVFILFLRHPEGIRFKDLVDYYDELLWIYKSMNPIGTSKKQAQSIQAVTNPMSNSINEKCAQIREAFIRHFDDSLAKNYYITGKKGEPKRIVLAPSLVIWEQ